MRAATGTAYPDTYDVADLLGPIAGLDKLDAVGILPQQFARPGETTLDRLLRTLRQLVAPTLAIEVINGRRLVIRARPSQHDEIESLLNALRRLCDVAVVMNAEVYAIDATFYQQRLEPMLRGPRLAVTIGGKLAEEVRQGAFLHKGEAERLRQARSSLVVSWSRPSAIKAPDGEQFLHEGYSCHVTPIVSADRRYIRLSFRCKSARIEKVASAEPRPAKTSEPAAKEDLALVFSSPQPTPCEPRAALASRSNEGAIEVMDGAWLLMNLDYPAPRPNQRLVLLARPILLIQEEEQAIRDGEETLKIAPIRATGP